MNTWTGGFRHAISQTEHLEWNDKNYPGTRQQCSACGCDTGRCEDDSLYADENMDGGPLCEECWESTRKEKQ